MASRERIIWALESLGIHRSPLESWHRNAKAKMTDFHGWTMPLHYTRVSQEVEATRHRAGLFDLCHMGRIQIRGGDRIAFADHLVTCSVENLVEGQLAYGFLCNDAGGVIDDVTVYRHADYVLFVVNASNCDRVMTWFQQHAGRFKNLKIENRTGALGMIAVQGPLANQIVESLAHESLAEVKHFWFDMVKIAGHGCLISRSGYTGEDGFEIYCNFSHTEPMWKALIAEAAPLGGLPVGLAARDILRLEACLPLHGQELTSHTTPIEVNLERFVDFDKQEFVGRRALIDSSSSDANMRLVAFKMVGARAIPRTGQSLCHQDVGCGQVTSGCHSPTLNHAVGMGFVEQSFARVGQSLQVRIRGNGHLAEVVKRPFYRRKRAS
jgi:aminomethyltransferase